MEFDQEVSDALHQHCCGEEEYRIFLWSKTREGQQNCGQQGGLGPGPWNPWTLSALETQYTAAQHPDTGFWRVREFGAPGSFGSWIFPGPFDPWTLPGPFDPWTLPGPFDPWIFPGPFDPWTLPRPWVPWILPCTQTLQLLIPETGFSSEETEMPTVEPGSSVEGSRYTGSTVCCCSFLSHITLSGLVHSRCVMRCVSKSSSPATNHPLTCLGMQQRLTGAGYNNHCLVQGCSTH